MYTEFEGGFIYNLTYGIYGIFFCFSGKGDLFGTDLGYEEAIVKSNCDVKSLTYCDLQCIHLSGLRAVLDMYPEYSDKFKGELQNELTVNLREGYVDPEEEDDNMVTLPAVTLPSISEDDELEGDEEDENENEAKETSPLSPPNNEFPSTLPGLPPGLSQRKREPITSIPPLFQKQSSFNLPNNESSSR